MPNFLDELDGDFVKHVRSNASVAGLIGGDSTGARIYPEMARQGAALPHITYTRAAGHSLKTHSGRGDGCETMVLHVYCWAETNSAANDLAVLVRNHLLDTEGMVGDGTIIHVCNGGIVDSGVVPSMSSSDKKKFWTRLVLRMLVQ